MAEIIFEYIKDYGFMHCSHLINEAVIQATRLSLANIGAYLESRLKEVKHCFKTNTQK